MYIFYWIKVFLKLPFAISLSVFIFYIYMYIQIFEIPATFCYYNNATSTFQIKKRYYV